MKRQNQENTKYLKQSEQKFNEQKQCLNTTIHLYDSSYLLEFSGLESKSNGSDDLDYFDQQINWQNEEYVNNIKESQNTTNQFLIWGGGRNSYLKPSKFKFKITTSDLKQQKEKQNSNHLLSNLMLTPQRQVINSHFQNPIESYLMKRNSNQHMATHHYYPTYSVYRGDERINTESSEQKQQNFIYNVKFSQNSINDPRQIQQIQAQLQKMFGYEESQIKCQRTQVKKSQLKKVLDECICSRFGFRFFTQELFEYLFNESKHQSQEVIEIKHFAERVYNVRNTLVKNLQQIVILMHKQQMKQLYSQELNELALVFMEDLQTISECFIFESSFDSMFVKYFLKHFIVLFNTNKQIVNNIFSKFLYNKVKAKIEAITSSQKAPCSSSQMVLGSHHSQKAFGSSSQKILYTRTQIQAIFNKISHKINNQASSQSIIEYIWINCLQYSKSYKNQKKQDLVYIKVFYIEIVKYQRILRYQIYSKLDLIKVSLKQKQCCQQVGKGNVYQQKTQTQYNDIIQCLVEQIENNLHQHKYLIQLFQLFSPSKIFKKVFQEVESQRVAKVKKSLKIKQCTIQSLETEQNSKNLHQMKFQKYFYQISKYKRIKKEIQILVSQFKLKKTMSQPKLKNKISSAMSQQYFQNSQILSHSQQCNQMTKTTKYNTQFQQIEKVCFEQSSVQANSIIQKFYNKDSPQNNCFQAFQSDKSDHFQNKKQHSNQNKRFAKSQFGKKQSATKKFINKQAQYLSSESQKIFRGQQVSKAMDKLQKEKRNNKKEKEIKVLQLQESKQNIYMQNWPQDSQQNNQKVKQKLQQNWLNQIQIPLGCKIFLSIIAFPIFLLLIFLGLAIAAPFAVLFWFLVRILVLTTGGFLYFAQNENERIWIPIILVLFIPFTVLLICLMALGSNYYFHIFRKKGLHSCPFFGRFMRQFL